MYYNIIYFIYSVFNQMGLMNINLITKSEYDSAMEALAYLRDLASNIPTLWDINNISFVINNKVCNSLDEELQILLLYHPVHS